MKVKLNQRLLKELLLLILHLRMLKVQMLEFHLIEIRQETNLNSQTSSKKTFWVTTTEGTQKMYQIAAIKSKAS